MKALKVFYNETDQAHSPTNRYKVMEALKVFCLIQTKLNPHQQVQDYGMDAVKVFYMSQTKLTLTPSGRRPWKL
jgi:hypothetical protein